MSRFDRFVRRLRKEVERRRVHHVVVGYAAGAWVLLQVADVGLPALGFDDAVMTMLVVTVIVGFPVAVSCAWFFDLTATAAEPTDEIGELVGGSAASMAGFAVVAIASIFVAGAGAWFLTGRGDGDPVAPTPSALTADRKSIAVLPFTIEGLDPNAATFIANGLHDDLLTQLSRVSSLRVVSRTSVMGYRDTTMRIPEIARELGVGTILEGGVQQSGDRLRMNVQLIDAATDEHMWGATFDRRVALDSIFELQRQLVDSIADALQARLTPQERQRIQEIPTTNLEAYNFFLRGNEYFANRLLEEPMRRAIEMYRSAVELDPEFALAHARLSEVRSLYYAQAQPSDSIRTQALASAQRALELQPDLDEAVLADGYFRYWVLADLESALPAFQAVLPRQPNNAELHWLLGSIHRRLNELETSTSFLVRAAELDPRSPIYRLEAAVNLAMEDREAEALEQGRMAMELAPGWMGGYLNTSILQARFGNLEASRDVMREAMDRLGADIVLSQLALTPFRLHLLALGPEFQDRLITADRASLQADASQLHLTFGRIFAERGQQARARAHFDSARVVLEESVEQRPGEPAFAADLSLAYVGLDRDDEAIRLATRATQLRPVELDAITGYTWLMNLLNVQLQAGRFNDAVATLTRARTLPYRPSRQELELHPWFEEIQVYPPFQELVSGW